MILHCKIWPQHRIGGKYSLSQVSRSHSLSYHTHVDVWRQCCRRYQHHYRNWCHQPSPYHDNQCTRGSSLLAAYPPRMPKALCCRPATLLARLRLAAMLAGPAMSAGKDPSLLSQQVVIAGHSNEPIDVDVTRVSSGGEGQIRSNVGGRGALRATSHRVRGAPV